MRARDLQTTLPIVDRTTTALDAARLIARDGLPALVVADEAGNPAAVLSAVDVLGLLVPGYVLDDMSLAGVFDEKGSEEVWGAGRERVLGELLDDIGVRVRDILVVDAAATVVEVAARMADARAHIALVADHTATEPGFVQLPAVMDAILRFTPHQDGASA